ncbi:MAG: type II toxin-antitoxin system VapB family antitoxin [Syntrophorhabdales bacterium]|jgi:Arc/MetJ family transcription regulator
MRATLNIPDELVKEAQEATGAKTKTETIVIALKELVRRKKVEELIALRGKIQIDYDWEAEEVRELEAQREREESLGQQRS